MPDPIKVPESKPADDVKTPPAVVTQPLPAQNTKPDTKTDTTPKADELKPSDPDKPATTDFAAKDTPAQPNKEELNDEDRERVIFDAADIYEDLVSQLPDFIDNHASADDIVLDDDGNDLFNPRVAAFNRWASNPADGGPGGLCSASNYLHQAAQEIADFLNS